VGNDLDLEWVELILEAKDIGLTEEEIRKFFEEVREGEALVRR
jgi:DNA-binding transcriptional MerR regulator